MLTKVAHGEFPLGIIWQTDTADEQRIRIVATLPEASHPPIVYPLAVLANSTGAGAGPHKSSYSSGSYSQSDAWMARASRNCNCG